MYFNLSSYLITRKDKLRYQIVHYNYGLMKKYIYLIGIYKHSTLFVKYKVYFIMSYLL